jgi:hypothetical protein
MASVFYDAALQYIVDGTVSLTGDSIYAMLVTASYSPNQGADNYRNDVTNEVTGTGYTTAGQALASKAYILDTSGHTLAFDADDVTWTGATITARACVVYKHRGGASSADELICYVDFGSNITSTGGNFTITWNAAGIFYY